MSNNNSAIVVLGGRQHRVSAGEHVLVPGKFEKIVVDQVLAAYKEDGQLLVGTPTLDNVKVTAKVLGQVKGPKIVSFKKRRRKNSRRKIGSRHEFTKVLIENVQI